MITNMTKETQRNSKKGYIQVSTQVLDGETDTPFIVDEISAEFSHLTYVNLCLLVEYIIVAAIGSKVLLCGFGITLITLILQ